jgi:predicted O-methyltransferase YrrM
MKTFDSLRNQLELNKDIPFTKDWSAAADFIQLIVDDCLEKKPEIIFECSSGLTTLMLARCCQINGQGKVYSLENGLEYAEKTESFLRLHDLEEYVSVIHAPLENTRVNDTDFSWYSTNRIPDKAIDMLVIDGPPGFLQKNSRYPALPLLFKNLAKHSIVFLDDAARDDEKEIIELWKNEHAEVKHEYIETERGCSVLTIDKVD